MIQLMGYIAAVITVIYTAFGLGNQIKVNIERQCARALSPIMLVMMCCTFLSWVIYSELIGDWFILLPNTIGFIFSLILIFQRWQQQ